MNDLRQFRLLVPPFFLALSVVVGLYFSDFEFGNLLNSYSANMLVAVGAIIAASILPIGFFITSLSILALHLVFRLFTPQPYEAVLPTEIWERIWSLLKIDRGREVKWHLYAAASFDHKLLPVGVHEWLQRRWSTFNISVHSAFAIGISHIAVLHPMVSETCQWLLVSTLLFLVFVVTGGIAWVQTMRMLEFQVQTLKEPAE